MPKEKSVGAVVFRKCPSPEFLLLHYAAGHWGFPKGHVKEGESERRTLLREVEEETGLRNVALLPGFKQNTSYFFRRDGQTIFKEVVFYLLEAKQGKVRISHEHQGFQWLPFQNALKQLSFKNTKEVLRKASASIKQP